MANISRTVGAATNSAPFSPPAGLWLGAIACLVLAMNAAGQIHTGLLGLLSLIAVFLLLGVVGSYWYVASIHFLTQWMGLESQVSKPWLVTLQGIWPLILLGPAVSAQRWWPSFGKLFTLCILVSLGGTLIRSIHRAYAINWTQASLCVAMTILLGSLAIVGLIGWPLMLILGTKSFGIMLSLLR